MINLLLQLHCTSSTPCCSKWRMVPLVASPTVVCWSSLLRKGMCICLDGWVWMGMQPQSGGVVYWLRQASKGQQSNFQGLVGLDTGRSLFSSRYRLGASRQQTDGHLPEMLGAFLQTAWKCLNECHQCSHYCYPHHLNRCQRGHHQCNRRTPPEAGAPHPPLTTPLLQSFQPRQPL